jgi:hypothetical protein
VLSALLLAIAASAPATPAAATPVPVAAAPIAPAASVATGAEPVTDPTSYTFAQSNRVEVGSGLTNVSADANSGVPRAGYYPLRIFIDNSSGPREKMTLSFASMSDAAAQVSKTIDVAQGERRTVSLIVPAALRYGKLQARAPGVTQNESGAVYLNPGPFEQMLVLSLGTSDDFEKAMGRPPMSSPTAATSAAMRVLAFPAAEAPTELAAYAGFGAVVIPGIQLDALSEGARRALEAYAVTGGTVIAAHAGRSYQQYFPLANDGTGRPSDYGFGRVSMCEACATIDFGELTDKTQRRELAVFPPRSDNQFAGSWRFMADQATTPYGEVLLAQATAPMGTFLIIISLFTLVIGPGSIWVARRRGPAALLLTIPGTAFVSCVLIVGSSVLKDGFATHASLHGYTEIDARNHRAITAGMGAYYANLSPSGATFDTMTAVMASNPDYDESFGVAMDWGESLTAGSGFLPSRTYREWGFLSVAPTRARVIVKSSADGVRIQNALGSKVRSLVVSTERGYFEVNNLLDGSEAVGVRISDFVSPSTPGSADRRFGAELLKRRGRPLGHGEYLAEVEGLGFLPSAGLKLEHDESLQFVRGAFE